MIFQLSWGVTIAGEGLQFGPMLYLLALMAFSSERSFKTCQRLL
jgi:hypothetical protein